MSKTNKGTRQPFLENMSSPSDSVLGPQYKSDYRDSGPELYSSMALPLVSLIGGCIKEGQHWHTGVEDAPRIIHEAGLQRVLENLGRGVVVAGNVTSIASDQSRDVVEEGKYTPNEVKNGSKLGEALGRLHHLVRQEADKGNFVLTIGGDHSVASASISAIKLSCDSRNQKLAVVWVDAHADCNTPETSGSGNFHGMPVGILMGWFKKKVRNFEWIESYLQAPLPENRLAFIGLRDVDEEEKRLLRQSKILVYSMIDVERKGISAIMDEINAEFADSQLHLSFDIDGIDPLYAPGTGTRAKGGLNYREARYICTSLASSRRLMSMDLVEVNPSLDNSIPSGNHEHGDNPLVSPTAPVTVKLAIDLIEFAIGKTLV